MRAFDKLPRIKRRKEPLARVPLVMGVVAFVALGAFAWLGAEGPPPVEERVEPSRMPLAGLPRRAGALAPDTCRLTVVALVDGAPADQARFDLALVGPHRTEATWSAVPREGGRHTWDLPRGIFHLSAFHPGRAAHAAVPLVCEGDGLRALRSVVFDAEGVVVRGRIASSAGRTLRGPELLVEQEDGQKGGLAGVLHVPVDEAGRFEVRLAPGRYQVLALAEGHTSEKRVLDVKRGAGEIEMPLALAYRPVVRGRVVDEQGHPVPGARVYRGPLFDPRVPASVVVADEEGRFEAPVLPRQKSLLTAHAGALLGSIEVAADPDPRAEVELVVREGREVSGHLMRRDGRAHAFGEVQYRVRELGLLGTAKADAEGRFTLPGMPRGLDVELWAKGSAIGAWGAQVASPGRDRVLLTFMPPAY